MSREASAPTCREGLVRSKANRMVDQKHKPKWHLSHRQRKNATPVRPKMTAEYISAHRFQGVSLRRQTPVARCVADFVSDAAKFIVDVEGGQYFEPETIVRPARRNACLTAQGCGVVDFNNLDVMKNTVGVPAATAVALSGSPPPCLTLPRRRGIGPGHAGREDVR
jgi:very-short-patch-repair endonuclease